MRASAAAVHPCDRVVKTRQRPQCNGRPRQPGEGGESDTDIATLKGWYIANGTHYTLEILLFDARNHLMHIAPNMQFQLAFIGDSMLPTSAVQTLPAPAKAKDQDKTDKETAELVPHVTRAVAHSAFVPVFGAALGSSRVSVTLPRVVNNRTGIIHEIEPPLVTEMTVRVVEPVRVCPLCRVWFHHSPADSPRSGGAALHG